MEMRNRRPPTPYPELNRMLQDLVERVQAVLRTIFVGAYLQGVFGSEINAHLAFTK